MTKQTFAIDLTTNLPFILLETENASGSVEGVTLTIVSEKEFIEAARNHPFYVAQVEIFDKKDKDDKDKKDKDDKDKDKDKDKKHERTDIAGGSPARSDHR